MHSRRIASTPVGRIACSAVGTMLLAVMAVAPPAVAAEPPILDGPTSASAKMLEKNAPRPPVIFGGACRQPKLAGGNTIVFIIPGGRTQGYVFDMNDNGGSRIVANIGLVTFSKGVTHVEENMGGLWTTNMLRTSVQKIADTRLRAFSSYGGALTQQAAMKCPVS